MGDVGGEAFCAGVSGEGVIEGGVIVVSGAPATPGDAVGDGSDGDGSGWVSMACALANLLERVTAGTRSVFVGIVTAGGAATGVNGDTELGAAGGTAAGGTDGNAGLTCPVVIATLVGGDWLTPNP